MKFVRRSITRKALVLFAAFAIAILVAAFTLDMMGIQELSTYLTLTIFTFIIALVLFIFVLFVADPLNKVNEQVQRLLTGKNYNRLEPTSIDEIGTFTHFFNEITRDLEKISYDIKERRRMSSELDIAASIQKNVLPKEAPSAPGLDIVAKTKSAAEVGGDTFDFVESPDGNHVFIYIGDVTGHGVPAGLIMMMVDTLVTALVSQGITNGKDLVAQTNRLLTPRISSRLFMTSVILRWDKINQKMYYTGAGHEHILVYRAATESVEAIRAGGIALGMISDVSKIVEENEITLEVGDSIVLYTDGITEARNQSGEMYDLEKLQKSLKKHGYRPSAANIFDKLSQEFSSFVGEYIQSDDITMIVINYIGKEAGTKKVQLTIGEEDKTKESTQKNWDWTD